MHPPKRVLKGSRSRKASRVQGSELPRGRETDAGIAAVIPAAVDVQTAAVEVADEDAVTVITRGLVRTADATVGKEPLTGGQEMDDHTHDYDTGRRDFIIRRQERLLLREVPPEGIFHRIHLELTVARRFFELRERQVVVPVLGIEDRCPVGDFFAELRDAPAGIEERDKPWKCIGR